MYLSNIIKLSIQRNTQSMHMAVYMTLYSSDPSSPKKNMAMYMMYTLVYIQELEELGPEENTGSSKT